MLILGIETSCDETGAAVVAGQTNSKKVLLLSNVVASSLAIHAKSGGIIPENAAREQIKYIIPVIEKAIENCKLKIENLDAVSVTYGPGLIGSLLIGIETAKTLSYIWRKPLIPVNHLLGHIYANFIDEQTDLRGVVRVGGIPTARSGVARERALAGWKRATGPRASIEFPTVALVVSGGHTDLVLMKNHGSLQWLGGTRDDAAGECFDKCARLLGYSYPGGPKISQLATKGNPEAFPFPRPMLGTHDFEFSFSGLKTAFLNETKQRFPILRTSDKKIGWDQISLEEQLKQSHKQTLYDLCASLQKAIIDVLVKKTLTAAKQFGAKSILLGGGVAANNSLRENFKFQISNFKLGAQLFVPTKSLCTDNAAMIAAAAFFNNQEVSWRNLDANPNLYFNSLNY